MKRRSGESGFALLLVFVMAAAIAITLYVEVPRIAFESQRAREQMAIDRGLQYKRAIQLFYRKYQTFPQTLDDLETSRNIRFLRRRYLDPLTGKEWRLLHVGPSGQLTDSLVQPPAPLPGSTTGSGQSLTGPSQTFGSSPTAPTQSSNASQPVDPNNPNAQAPDPLNMALRRPSDRIQRGGGPGAQGAEPPVEEPQEPDPNQPQQAGQPIQQPFQQTNPAQPGQEPADPNQPTPQDPTQPQNAGLQPAIPGQPLIPGQQPLPGQQPGNPQDPASGATSTQPPTGLPTQQPPPGANPAQTPGFQQTPSQQAGQQPFIQQPFGQQVGQQIGQSAGLPGQAGAGGAPAPNQNAANLIQQILTTPRQPPSSTGGFTSGNTGGIAGVASTAEGKGIHVINDHSKYKEWEFYYDLKKDKTVVGVGAVNQQQQVQQQMQQNGTNNPLGSSPFGGSPAGSNSPGGNSSSPFSSTPTNSPNSGAPAAPTTPPPSQ